MRPNRREFLRAATLGVTGYGATVVRAAAGGAGASGSAQESSLRGSAAGEVRVLDGIAVCWCPPGRFAMGSPSAERGHRPDEAQADVVLTRGFWTAKHEVTQGQWRRVIGAFPDRLPSAEFGEGDDFPVYWINFDEAENFCSALTRRSRGSGALPEAWEFRLPTEAQWEYACRAGTVDGHVLRRRARRASGQLRGRRRGFSVRERGSARKVGSYPANAWGIHDMHGNVWEWCRDYYHARLPGRNRSGSLRSKGVPNRDATYSRVRRGGAWIEPGWACRSACRLRYEPHRRSDHIGFRVVVVER